MDDLLKLPIKDRIRHFENTLSTNDYIEVKRGFRSFSAMLFKAQEISMTKYVSVFGGHAIHCITQDGLGQFKDMHSGADLTILLKSYSRAKHGSIEDIRLLANMVIANLAQALDSPDSHWSRLFVNAKEHGDSVALMTTGWRNVPSTANVLYDIVVERINLKLAHLGLPTIINVKLPRIAPPCENYASLSLTEREHVNLVQDHVIPDRNFYVGSGVHVIFGDDILVTGSTADKVFFESARNGAKSFQSIYPIAVDPNLAHGDATIEECINMVAISGQLDDTFASILSHRDFQPILRSIRLIFAKSNHEGFRSFLARVPARTWLKLYVAALGNEFLQQEDCKPSLRALKNYLTDAKFLCAEGMVSVP